MAATSTIRSTATRSHTSGAVNPAIDCATIMSFWRFPMALTTTSVYSASPAESSSQGKSGATTVWPRALRSGVTRCQYQESDPAP